MSFAQFSNLDPASDTMSAARFSGVAGIATITVVVTVEVDGVVVDVVDEELLDTVGGMVLVVLDGCTLMSMDWDRRVVGDDALSE